MKIVIEKNVTEIFPHMQVCYGIFKAVDIESIPDIDFTTLGDLDADLSSVKYLAGNKFITVFHTTRKPEFLSIICIRHI